MSTLNDLIKDVTDDASAHDDLLATENDDDARAYESLLVTENEDDGEFSEISLKELSRLGSELVGLEKETVECSGEISALHSKIKSDMTFYEMVSECGISKADMLEYQAESEDTANIILNDMPIEGFTLERSSIGLSGTLTTIMDFVIKAFTNMVGLMNKASELLVALVSKARSFVKGHLKSVSSPVLDKSIADRANALRGQYGDNAVGQLDTGEYEAIVGKFNARLSQLGANYIRTGDSISNFSADRTLVSDLLDLRNQQSKLFATIINLARLTGTEAPTKELQDLLATIGAISSSKPKLYHDICVNDKRNLGDDHPYVKIFSELGDYHPYDVSWVPDPSVPWAGKSTSKDGIDSIVPRFGNIDIDVSRPYTQGSLPSEYSPTSLNVDPSFYDSSTRAERPPMLFALTKPLGPTGAKAKHLSKVMTNAMKGLMASPQFWSGDNDDIVWPRGYIGHHKDSNVDAQDWAVANESVLRGKHPTNADRLVYTKSNIFKELLNSELLDSLIKSGTSCEKLLVAVVKRNTLEVTDKSALQMVLAIKEKLDERYIAAVLGEPVKRLN